MIARRQQARLTFANLFCDDQSSKSRDAATLLGQLAPLHKETRALATQRFEACAGRQGVNSWYSDFAASTGGWLRQLRREQAAEDSSGEGCSDLLACASRALRLEQVESQKRLPRESCGCAGLSPKLHCARLGRSRALGLRKRSSRAELLCLKKKGRRGADGCNDFERAFGPS